MKRANHPDRVDEMKAMRAAGKMLREIGNHFNVTKEYVRQLIGNTGRLPVAKQMAPRVFRKGDEAVALGCRLSPMQFLWNMVIRSQGEGEALP